MHHPQLGVTSSAVVLVLSVVLCTPSCLVAYPAADTADPHATATAIDAACKGLPPTHGTNVPLAATAAPYTLSVARDHISRGDTISVHLQGNDESVKFRGFLVQGRDVATGRPVGQFAVRGDDVDVKTIDCVRAGSRNTVFQKRSHEDKQYVDFVWQAPEDFDGRVVFDATVVKTFDTYWTGVESPVVTVDSN